MTDQPPEHVGTKELLLVMAGALLVLAIVAAGLAIFG
jgi:hypothetical protein